MPEGEEEQQLSGQIMQVAHRGIGTVDGDDGSVLTYLDTFVAAYAGFGGLDDDVLVKAKELIDLAKNLFGTSLVASPARLAVMRVSRNVSCTQYSVLSSHLSIRLISRCKGTMISRNFV